MRSKLSTLLLLLLGCSCALLAWKAAFRGFRDRENVLTDFLTVVSKQSKELVPQGKQPVPLPSLPDGQRMVLAMGPYITIIGDNIHLSKRIRAAIQDDVSAEGPALTFVYLVNKDEVLTHERVSRCNFTIPGNDPVVIGSAPKQTASIECGPVTIPSRPGECREVGALWNSQCVARLVFD